MRRTGRLVSVGVARACICLSCRGTSLQRRVVDSSAPAKPKSRTAGAARPGATQRSAHDRVGPATPLPRYAACGSLRRRLAAATRVLRLAPRCRQRRSRCREQRSSVVANHPGRRQPRSPPLRRLDYRTQATLASRAQPKHAHSCPPLEGNQRLDVLSVGPGQPAPDDPSSLRKPLTVATRRPSSFSSSMSFRPSTLAMANASDSPSPACVP